MQPLHGPSSSCFRGCLIPGFSFQRECADANIGRDEARCGRRIADEKDMGVKAGGNVVSIVMLECDLQTTWPQ